MPPASHPASAAVPPSPRPRPDDSGGFTRGYSARRALAASLAVMLCWTMPGPTKAQASASASASASAIQGRLLFEGDTPLSGRIRGHVDALPPASIRCVNCHVRASEAAALRARANAPATTQGFGPPLDGPMLAEPRPRRGGPPSAYDARRLCTALREGLDPNHVRMARNMPIYQLSDRDCDHLWAYLAGRPTLQARP